MNYAQRGWLKAVVPVYVVEGVASSWKMSLPVFLQRRRGCPAKGVAAWMLEKHAGLTRRAIAPLLGIKSGTGVGYQIGQAMERARTDSSFARQVRKIERAVAKEDV